MRNIYAFEYDGFEIEPVADLSFVAWGGDENFKGVPNFVN